MSSDKKKAKRLWEELTEEYHGKPRVDQSKQYWASEWSWSPMYDGYFPCKHEKYPYYQEKDGLSFYATNTSYRVYAPWDLFDTKEECEELCRRKNECGYEWDAFYNDMLQKYDLLIDPGEAERMGWVRFKAKVLSLRILDTAYPFLYGGTILTRLQSKPEKSAVFVNWENDNDWMIKIGVLDGFLPIYSPKEEFTEMINDKSTREAIKRNTRITLTI